MMVLYPPQTLTLHGDTDVDGNITFQHGNGVVAADSTVKITGKVIGGSVVHSRGTSTFARHAHHACCHAESRSGHRSTPRCNPQSPAPASAVSLPSSATGAPCTMKYHILVRNSVIAIVLTVLFCICSFFMVGSTPLR